MRVVVIFFIVFLWNSSAFSDNFREIPTLDATQMVFAIQRALKDQGYDTGEADGKWGKATEGTFAKFLIDKNLDTSNYRAILDALGFECFYTYQGNTFDLSCPVGCESSLILTQDGVSGWAVSCPNREDQKIHPFTRPK